MAFVEPTVEPAGLSAGAWFHGAEAARSHRATTKRLVPGDRLRRHGPTDRPQATVPPDGEDGREAQILLGKLLEQVAEGQQPDTGVTVAELLRRYMTVAERDRSTRQAYEGYIRRTILPALGSMELRKVRGPVLDMLYPRLHR